MIIKVLTYLPTWCWESTVQQSINISGPPGPQKQTRRNDSMGQTDRQTQTPDRVIDPAPHTMQAMSKTIDYVQYMELNNDLMFTLLCQTQVDAVKSPDSNIYMKQITSIWQSLFDNPLRYIKRDSLITRTVSAYLACAFTAWCSQTERMFDL